MTPPPPPEPAIEVVPLAIEKASRSILEEQSPILMIQGVLHELAPEEEAIESQSVVKRRKVQVQLRDKRTLRMGWLLLTIELSKSYLSKLKSFHLNP